MKTRLKVSKSFYKKIKRAEDLIEYKVKDILTEIADTAVTISPVDTGAYVTSFSFTTGSGRPRGKSSEGRPRKQDESQMKSEGFNNLMSDIDRITDFKEVQYISLTNASPHASDVEYGGPKWKTCGYGVFAELEDRYG
jgi:hypothetical protein